MEVRASDSVPDTAASNPALARRRLFLRDSLIFFILTLFTLALFGTTLLLFRSFATHRAVLAIRWASRGRADLAAGHPAEAVTALRNALTYDPDERSNQLLLAQALGEAGRTEESTNYFLNLWELTPGDGNINLQLARLARHANNQDNAVQYYRAAIYGSWQDDAINHRRAVRMELLHYLIAQNDLTSARSELLIAASDAPPTLESRLHIAAEFIAIDDPATALTWYQKALAADPRDPEALHGAGQVAAQLGDAPQAIDYLQRALEQPPRNRKGESKLTLAERAADEALIVQLHQTMATQSKSSVAKRRSR